MIKFALVLAPIFLLVAGGAALNRFKIIDPDYWRLSDRINYYILFPALLLLSVARANLSGLASPGLAAAALLPSLTALAGALLLRRALRVNGAGLSSVIQGVVRFNSYIGLACASALHGAEGVAAFAVLMTIGVPLFNVIAVTACVRGAAQPDAKPLGPKAIALEVARNPLITACIVGGILNYAGGPPPVVGPTLEILGGAALPLGLLSVGAGLRFNTLAQDWRAISYACAGRLLLCPLVAAGVIWLFGLHGLGREMAVLLGALPTAPAGYILARQLGGDAPLMSAIITAQVTAAIVTLPFVLSLGSLAG